MEYFVQKLIFSAKCLLERFLNKQFYFSTSYNTFLYPSPDPAFVNNNVSHHPAYGDLAYDFVPNFVLSCYIKINMKYFHTKINIFYQIFIKKIFESIIVIYEKDLRVKFLPQDCSII